MNVREINVLVLAYLGDCVYENTIRKYLISMGFNVDNELFKSKSKYFRNALVRANYTNYSKGIKAEKRYLKMFFENLLLGKNNKLDNNGLKIKQH